MEDKNFLKYDENGDLIIPSYETKSITEKVLLLREVQREMTKVYEKKEKYIMNVNDYNTTFRRKDGPSIREWDIMKDRDEREVADFLIHLMKNPDKTMTTSSFENYPEVLRGISNYFNELAKYYETKAHYDTIISQLILLEKGIKIELGIA